MHSVQLLLFDVIYFGTNERNAPLCDYISIMMIWEEDRTLPAQVDTSRKFVMKLSQWHFFFLIARDAFDTEKFHLYVVQNRTTISCSPRRRVASRRLRSEARHVQECGKYRRKYKTRFSCLLTPSLNSRRRRQARCVSHRCVFRIVAPDRIIFPAETLARLAFALVPERYRNTV